MLGTVSDFVAWAEKYQGVLELTGGAIAAIVGAAWAAFVYVRSERKRDTVEKELGVLGFHDVYLSNLRRFRDNVGNGCDEYLGRAFLDISPLPVQVTYRHQPDEPSWADLNVYDGKSEWVSGHGKQIDEFFAMSANRLLVLGQAGAGKTVLLYQIAKHILISSKHDLDFVIPVVVNLASWSQCEGGTFHDWLIRSITRKHSIGEDLCRRCLKDRRLFLLLDGLDEVAIQHRSTCVEGLNHFVTSKGVAGVAVTCRTADYRPLPTKFETTTAVKLDELSVDKVFAGLTQGEHTFTALAAVLKKDEGLLTFARTPLWLGLMSAAYRQQPDKLNELIEAKSVEQKRELILERYVEKCLVRSKMLKSRLSSRDIRKWLSAIAKRLVTLSMRTIQPEQLQPRWMSANIHRSLYYVCSRACTGLTIGICLGFYFAMDAHFYKQGISSLGEFGRSMLLGLIGGTTVGVIARVRSVMRRSVHVTVRWDRAGRILIDVFAYGGAAGLAGWLLGGGDKAQIYGIAFGLLYGLQAEQRDASRDTHVVQRLEWSAKRGIRGGIMGALIGLVIGPITGVIVGPNSYHIVVGTLSGIANGSVFGFLYGGILRRVPTSQNIFHDGIRLSFRNVFFASLRVAAAGLVLGCFLSMLFGRGSLENIRFQLAYKDILLASTYALLFGMLAGMWYGGIDIIHHYVVRLMLYVFGYLPWELREFLEHTDQIALMQKTGRGFEFRHDVVRTYFANVGMARNQVSFVQDLENTNA